MTLSDESETLVRELIATTQGSEPTTPSAQQKPEPKLEVQATRGFHEWLSSENASLALTTYQLGKVFFIGTQSNGAPWVFNRTVGRTLGMVSDDEGFWLSADGQITRYTDLVKLGGPQVSDIDALYAPRFSYYTGDLDIHDLGGTGTDAPFCVATALNAIAQASTNFSVEPVWRPPFVSRLVAEDRCHLNGMAMRDGRPAFATAVSQSDVFGGWRDHREDGGIVIDIDSNEIVCEGLSMPHSPRLHDGKLWLLQAGTGEFGFVDLDSGEFEAVAFCPGYLRGLTFLGGFALVGLSRPRHKTFSGLPLDQKLKDAKVSPVCGVYAIELSTGTIRHSVTFEGVLSEIYDVCVLPGVRQPSLLSPRSRQTPSTLCLPPDTA